MATEFRAEGEKVNPRATTLKFSKHWRTSTFYVCPELKSFNDLDLFEIQTSGETMRIHTQFQIHGI